MTMKKAIARIVAATLWGLAATAAEADYLQDHGSSVTIVDARPSEDSASNSGSVWMWNDNYGIQQVGDAATEPSRLALLQRDLNQGLEPGMLHSPLVLKRYCIRLDNQKAEVNQALAVAAVGVFGAFAGQTTGSGTASFFEIEIEAVVNDQLETVHLRYPNGRKVYANWGERKNVEPLMAAMGQAHAELISKIKANGGIERAQASQGFRRFSDMFPEKDAAQD
ncbi:hypothetical protein FHS83_003642 [Rhizomicrobium palustre]|uniref:DUF3313 domain-containing protein n=1 Tax=Rhizomicrobium palustre TaxID=189966 RepID=A0A846N2T8_9PROT|nr:hypothetical protein [Rhizomicrobium palustre]NIK90324.1 hypothetical protein [Rhizomicrobium palustre]